MGRWVAGAWPWPRLSRNPLSIQVCFNPVVAELVDLMERCRNPLSIQVCFNGENYYLIAVRCDGRNPLSIQVCFNLISPFGLMYFSARSSRNPLSIQVCFNQGLPDKSIDMVCCDVVIPYQFRSVSIREVAVYDPYNPLRRNPLSIQVCFNTASFTATPWRRRRS